MYTFQPKRLFVTLWTPPGQLPEQVWVLCQVQIKDSIYPPKMLIECSTGLQVVHLHELEHANGKLFQDNLNYPVKEQRK